MPSNMPALTQVFPVLLQVKAIKNAPRSQERGSVDPLDLRRRAFEALRELLGRLAARGSLVVWIDDLQWADADSAVLLEELLRPPGQPAMLTVLCFRSEETAAKPFLQALLERAGQDAWSTISLEPMTEDEALALIARLLPADSALTDRDKHRMTREAGGSPFVLEQLARYAGVNRLRPNQAPTFAAMFESAAGDALRRRRAASSRRWRSAAGRWHRSSSATRAGSRARGSLSWRCSAPPTSFAAAARRNGSRHITIGFARSLAAQIAPDAVRRIHGRDGAGARREAKRRLRGAVRALSGRRGSRARVDSSRSCRRESGRRARLRSGGVLLPAGSDAEPGIASRPRHGGKASRTRSPTPAGRPRPPTPTSRRPPAPVMPSEWSSNGARPSSSSSAGTSIAGLDLIRSVLAGGGHASGPAARAPRCSRCCGGAHSFGGAGCASFHGGSSKSTPMPSFAWTPAGRRRRDWQWWT